MKLLTFHFLCLQLSTLNMLKFLQLFVERKEMVKIKL